jgi:hypothetical protein
MFAGVLFINIVILCSLDHNADKQHNVSEAYNDSMNREITLVKHTINYDT